MTLQMDYEIDISNDQSLLSVDTESLARAVHHALQIEEVASAVISVTVVDNAAIHRLNREYLAHDYPTDVISFQLEHSLARDDGDDETPAEANPGAPAGRAAGAIVEGDIIVSAEYALESAERIGWSADNELLLYVIHGLLHICGYDDLTPGEKQIMRTRERAILGEQGLNPCYPDDTASTDGTEDSSG
ncbi:MAG: rRNA maturation RNase YbeY [Planctomycetaceae bacterium]|nr:rRNA maturation RNase YbeY [Planctomycetaceae bacterium]